ncbi:MAG TPA: hypothetical protein VGC00_11500 [Thermoanaerobaculia bacterium]|jgi:hypothetical protein
MRSNASRPCGACGSTLEEGFLLDRRQSLEAFSQLWIEGEPERSWLAGVKWRGRRRAEVVAMRCRKCGRLELWAPELAG